MKFVSVIEFGTKLATFVAAHPVRALVGATAFVIFVSAYYPVLAGGLSKGGESGAMDKGGSSGSVAIGTGAKAASGSSIIVDNPTFNAPSQIGGQGNTMNVNQPAFFERQARVDRRRDDAGDHLVVRVPVKPGGIWQPGTEVKFGFKLNRPCERWQVDARGETFGGVMTDVRMGPDKNTDTIFFSTTTVPRPGRDVVFDIVSAEPIEITQAEWGPVGP